MLIIVATFFSLSCMFNQYEGRVQRWTSRGVTPPRPARPAPPTGRGRKLTGRGGGGALRDFAVSPPFKYIEYFQ